jgi:hypothetical protein
VHSEDVTSKMINIFIKEKYLRDYIEFGTKKTHKKKKRKNKHEKVATKRPNFDFDVDFEFDFDFDFDANLVLVEVLFLPLLFAFVCLRGYLGKLCRMLMRANNGMEVIYQAQPT